MFNIIHLKKLMPKLLLVAACILAGILLCSLLEQNPSVVYLIIGSLLLFIASFTISTSTAFTMLLLSVSIVLPVLQLPFSDFTYLRLDDFVWLFLVVLIIFRNHIDDILNLRKTFQNLTPLFLFFFLAIISLFRVAALAQESSMPLMHSIWYLIKFFQSIIILALTLIYFPTEKRGAILNTTFFAGSILAIIAILQYINLIPMYEYHKLNKFSPGQISSILSSNSEHLGIYMVTSLFLGYASLQLSRHRISKIFICVALALMLVALILTGSRSSWIGFLIGNIIFFSSFITLKRRVGTLGLIISTLIILATYYPGIKEILLNSLYNENRIGSALHRVNSYMLFFEKLMLEPSIAFIGVGFMNWRYTLVSSTEITWAHNNYLSVLGELGVVGLVLFIWFWFRTLKISYQLSKSGDVWAKAYNSILIGYLFASLTSEILYPVWSFENMLFFIMLITGVILSANRQKQRDANVGECCNCYPK